MLTSEKSELLAQIAIVEKLAKGSKFTRMLNQPIKYSEAIAYRSLCYAKSKRPLIKYCTLFTGQKMQLALPSATDIYITGGKTHDSEIRLVRYMIKALSADSVYLDIGAHYGYFSLIAAKIATAGKVVAFEPTTFSFKIIAQNATLNNNFQALNLAVSDEVGSVTFYEFDNQFSEYNTGDISQFKEETWFKNNPPKAVVINTTTISDYCLDHELHPNFIKIDVEGLEDKVIAGAADYIKNASVKPVLIMEYLSPDRGNVSHQKAVVMMKHLGYDTYVINQLGELNLCVDIENHLMQSHIDSDNIVFKYKE